ncbi:FecR domain-containing protein [Sphingobacterium sp. lm-10]|uniref:FecR family protein n=1 Tax=Sphingobacterium sp. lm-10 TaxID=2944904 RepID=UPI0020227480|nr:FecR family protein [Sphingobacterium sp. lm-10]MCL7986607.1 FecR domain-containing protein [Sphingobacterium sp. lm-10]
MVDPTVEKLISDHSFVNYCLSKSAEDSAYWDNWWQQHPEYIDVVEEARQMVLLLVDRPTEEEFQIERTRLLNHVVASEKQIKLWIRRLWKPWMAAAGLLLIGGITYQVWKQTRNIAATAAANIAWVDQQVPDKKIMHVALADGTVVKLFPGSNFSYPAAFQDSIREVKLDGGGFFEVAHDAAKPFIIHTEEVAVRVLGTSFNMQAYDTDNQTKVALFNGEVLIEHHGKQQTLSPGQAFLWDKVSQSAHVESFDISQERQVSNGLLVFEHADYEEVTRQLTRKYGIKWQTNIPVKIQFSGTIDQESLEDVLNHLTYTTDYRFTLQHDTVRVQQN